MNSYFNKEDKFKFDIENIKKDFAIENMNINADEIDMLKKYNNNEISVESIVDNIKNNYKM